LNLRLITRIKPEACSIKELSVKVTYSLPIMNTEALPLNVYIQGQGFHILGLHDHPSAGRSLSVFSNHLSRRFQTFAPDLRGYGKSRCNSNFNMQDRRT
jgi:pimeloyl-ACP methyl ester carboxylesterase